MARLGLMLDLLETSYMYDVSRANTIQRFLRHHTNAFSFKTDQQFFDTYRLSKGIAKDLIHELEPFLTSTNRLTGVPTDAKVLTAIAFYASGLYQKGEGLCPKRSVSQQIISRCVRQVTSAFNCMYMRNKYIRFPQTQEEKTLIKQGFSDKFNIPGVLGCIDGTHIAINRPLDNEEWYNNQKNYHSLNTQIISDSDLNILSVDARMGGQSHDSGIWEVHPVREYLEQLRPTYSTWLLGDSSYAQRKYMMTPIMDTEPNSPEEHYTACHRTALSSVERTTRVLKSRWRCLLGHRVLQYDPCTAGEIVNACVILHNIANKANLPVAELTKDEIVAEGELQIARSYADYDQELGLIHTRSLKLAEGIALRDNLVRRLWQHQKMN